MEWYHSMLLIYYFLMIDGIEYFVICVLANWISSSVKCLFISESSKFLPVKQVEQRRWLFQTELKPKVKPGVFCGWQGLEPGLFLLATSLACTPSLTPWHRPRWPASSSLRLDGILSGVNARTFGLTIPFPGDCLTVVPGRGAYALFE